jgi:hypothetical protein
VGADKTSREAAAMLRRVLEAVERGELEGESSQARALVRRIEGAVVALETPRPKQDRKRPTPPAA